MNCSPCSAPAVAAAACWHLRQVLRRRHIVVAAVALVSHRGVLVPLVLLLLLLLVLGLGLVSWIVHLLRGRAAGGAAGAVRGRLALWHMDLIYDFSAEWMEWMLHRKQKEAKQQPGKAGPGNILGCCCVSLSVSCATYAPSTQYCNLILDRFKERSVFSQKSS